MQGSNRTQKDQGLRGGYAAICYICLIYSERGGPLLHPLRCLSDPSLEPVAITPSETVNYGCDSSWVRAVSSLQGLLTGYLLISISRMNPIIFHMPPTPAQPLHIHSICVCPRMHMHLF